MAAGLQQEPATAAPSALGRGGPLISSTPVSSYGPPHGIGERDRRWKGVNVRGRRTSAEEGVFFPGGFASEHSIGGGASGSTSLPRQEKFALLQPSRARSA